MMTPPRALLLVVLHVALLGSADSAAAQGAGRVRVACLGDSITAGHQSGVAAEDVAYCSYPSRLSSILGQGFEVRGFGAGGHSLRSDAALVYADSKAADEAMRFAPDVAVIILGTNDSVRPAGYGAWDADLDALLQRLRAANGAVHIWLASPPPMFPARSGLTPERRQNLEARKPKLAAITSTLRSMAEARGDVSFLDLTDSLRAQDVTDGVHPGPFGAERIAYRVAASIKGAPIPRTTTPVPAVEYRGKAAGWGGGTWRDAFASLQTLGTAAAKEEPTDVLFLGDSITQGLTGHTHRWSSRGGKRVFDEFHGDRRAVSLGLSGDRTEHLLFRIREGSLDGFRPRKIVLQIGINNINAAAHSGWNTGFGIRAVVEELEKRFPSSHILVTGPFPGGLGPESRTRQQVESAHELLRQSRWGPRVDVLNLSHLFVGQDGALLQTMSGDGIHISKAGQRAWMEAIEPYFTAPFVEEEEGDLTMALGSGVTVCLERATGPKSLDIGSSRVEVSQQTPRPWVLNGQPCTFAARSYLNKNGAVRVSLQPTLSSEAEGAHEITETWRLASLGAARGYDRVLNVRAHGPRDQGPTVSRTAQAPFEWKITQRPVVDFYGYSTVSSPGVTYTICRIEASGGAKGWWFRSGYHFMNQAMNPGIDPTLREVVLLEPAGVPPVSLEEVIGAYVQVPQDRATLLRNQRREKSPK